VILDLNVATFVHTSVTLMIRITLQLLAFNPAGDFVPGDTHAIGNVQILAMIVSSQYLMWSSPVDIRRLLFNATSWNRYLRFSVTKW
jgi:hypothetical protein